jgi:glycosyltransferase involved in cell wall biosynthesis
MTTYSIVIPVYNEAEAIPALYARLTDLLERLDGTTEVILVDDGSRDGSPELISELHRRDARFKVVRLSRNFGHQTAITAGMDLTRGEAVIVMDADLQDPPEVVLEMAKRWRDGFEVVYGVRNDRTTDTWFKRTTANLFYRGLRRLTDTDIPADVGDFRLMDRRVVEATSAMREGSRFVRGMVASVGFKQTGVSYERQARIAGETKYPLRKMLRLAADGVVGFSRLPLRLTLQAGLLVAALSLVGGIVALGMKLGGVFTVPGWASLVFVVCLLGGVQLLVIGLIGEYLGRTYEESLQRPIYIVSDLEGVDEPLESRPRAVIALPRRPSRPGPRAVADSGRESRTGTAVLRLHTDSDR